MIKGLAHAAKTACAAVANHHSACNLKIADTRARHLQTNDQLQFWMTDCHAFQSDLLRFLAGAALGAPAFLGATLAFALAFPFGFAGVLAEDLMPLSWQGVGDYRIHRLFKVSQS